MPRIRSRPRTLFLLIVIAACLLGAVALRRRSGALQRRAARHEAEKVIALNWLQELQREEEESYSALAGPYMARDETTRPMNLRDHILECRASRSAMNARVAWQERMARKYAYAASRPWLIVEADPPEPPIPPGVTRRIEFDKWFQEEFEQRFLGNRTAGGKVPNVASAKPVAKGR